MYFQRSLLSEPLSFFLFGFPCPVNSVAELQPWVARNIWESWIGLFKSRCPIHVLTFKTHFWLILKQPYQAGEYSLSRMTDVQTGSHVGPWSAPAAAALSSIQASDVWPSAKPRGQCL